MNPEVARELMKDISIISDTKRMSKWKLQSDSSIAALLSCPRLIHPVKHDGVGVLFYGKIYAWAGFDTMEVKYDKYQMVLSLKIKTYCFDTGSPEISPQLVAYAANVPAVGCS